MLSHGLCELTDLDSVARTEMQNIAQLLPKIAQNVANKKIKINSP